MTSPDQQVPESASTVTTVSQLQYVTQDTIAQAATADIREMLDQVGLTFITNLLGGFANVANSIASAINQFISNLVYGLKNITGGIIDLTGFLRDSHETAYTAQNIAGTANTTANTAYTVAQTANLNAGDAITAAEAAANLAAAAQETADFAYGLSSYWEAEALVASSGVVQGVNELVIGLCQNVPDDTDRFITDLHIALAYQPGGLTINMIKVDLNGANPTTVHTATLGANVTRINYNALSLEVFDKERVHWVIPPGGVVGSIAPIVLQCLIFGVILAE